MPGTNLLKLNLGSGQNPKAGYVNVDKFGNPDVLLDLESFPWPWETSSVDEIVLHHVMEHLGASAEVYFKIMQEMYRVCKPGALIHITVPHPRHNHFAFDPTHVRGILPEGFM
ncbi:MAG: methyltransferase domain-containing protein, partial [Cyanobacteria bacterium]|nr:methyltransferase domain-containing protein [Cyanobacteriota bacterium]